MIRDLSEISCSGLIFKFALVVISFSFACEQVKDPTTILSPDGHLEVLFDVNEIGQPVFRVSRDNEIVLEESPLGVILNDENIGQSLRLIVAGPVEKVEDHYSMWQGKQHEITYQANERVFQLESKAGTSMNIIFRVSDDGVAFRYGFPNDNGQSQMIQEELTAYQFPDSTRMWVQPMSVAKTGWEHCHPSYEEDYLQNISVETPSTLGAGWIYPALFQSGENWILITEAGLGSDYCGTRLESVNGKMKVEFPSDQEVFTGGGHLPNSNTAWNSPWRVLTIGDLGTIASSTLGTDLADPAIEMNTDFVQPGYASWSWAVLKDNSVNYETTRQFIDYAADMNWKYCLIDADWHKRIGLEKIKELVAQGNDRGVGLLVWYNSAGDWNTTPYGPRSKLLTHEQRMEEFAMLRDMGIKGVKIDFFGGDGQSMIAYYHDILKDAAGYGLLVNFHGATLPRGWQRTYPHLMTMEAIKGFEFITFFQEVADREPTHACMLPFTRNAFDPMDFTPMCFSDIPGRERKTTNAFELALPTVFQSGIQHLAEIPEGMAAVPDYVREYLSNLPPQLWDETRLVEGYPGKLVVLARRSGDDWYVSGINGESQEKELTLNLGFIGKCSGYMITDGAQHPDFNFQEVNLNGSMDVSIKPNGGFVMKLKMK